MAAEGLTNAIALGQERIKKVAKFQGQETHPLFKWVMNQSKKALNEFGRRIILYLSEDGGETFFTYSDPSFRDYVPPEYDAMRVYPARFAKAVVLNGDMLRGLKRGDDNYFLRYQEKMDNAARAARKILSRHFHGDATGTLAVSQSTIAQNLTNQTLAGQVSSGGTSAQASTKGTAWLKKGETYEAINPATEAIRGEFTVVTEGRQSCVINTANVGTGIASGDKIVQKGSYKKVPVGLRHLASASNRVLQNYNTANAPQLNTPQYAGGGAAVSPTMFAVAKGLVETFANDETEAQGKLVIMTPGHQVTLTAQGFQYREYVDPKGRETISGFSGWKYVDQEGDTHFIDADAPDEQIRILDRSSYGVGEDMPWGLYDDDGNQWRMRHGTNNAGSDVYFTAIGWHGQLEKAGVALCDAIIDNVAHTGADFPKQAY